MSWTIEASRKAGDETLLSRKRHGVELQPGSGSGRREPDLVPIRRPRNPLGHDGGPALRQRPLLARRVHDADVAGHIPAIRAKTKAIRFAVRRKARAANPSIPFVSRRTFPTGYSSRCRPSTARTIAKRVPLRSQVARQRLSGGREAFRPPGGLREGATDVAPGLARRWPRRPRPCLRIGSHSITRAGARR